MVIDFSWGASAEAGFASGAEIFLKCLCSLGASAADAEKKIVLKAREHTQVQTNAHERNKRFGITKGKKIWDTTLPSTSPPGAFLCC
jgi:hypothetical protein